MMLKTLQTILTSLQNTFDSLTLYEKISVTLAVIFIIIAVPTLWYAYRAVKLQKVSRRENEKERINQILKPFEHVDKAFEAEINKNFLFEFDGPNTDYLQLLSDDFRLLFFKFFNERNRTNEFNRVCIEGREGVGKTFNSLLIGKKLKQQGYYVYYCEDVTNPSLSKEITSKITSSFNEHSVFIIDNCQVDNVKTGQIVKGTISGDKDYCGKPTFVFLTQPLPDKEDIFGKKTKTNKFLKFKKEWVDFNHLTELFFEKVIKSSDKIDNFLSSLQQNDLSDALFRYRNMAFWNEFFRSIKDTLKIRFDKTEFYQCFGEFLKKHEPHLIQERCVLAKLLPFFANGIPIHKNYVLDNLQISESQIQKLEENNIISSGVRKWIRKDWNPILADFIVCKIHPTKAKLIAALLEMYDSVEINIVEAITDYAEEYYENLYYIITPFYDSEGLEDLCSDHRFLSILKRYLKERNLGKSVDRVIKTFAKLGPQIKNILLDDEVIASLAEKLNGKQAFMVSKLNLLRAMYKIAPYHLYKLYQKFDTKVIIDDFNKISDETGLSSLVKFIEIFKHVYNFVDNEEEKASIVNAVKEILDGCYEAFVRRFEKDSSFSHFHWLLVYLSGIDQLCIWFLEKVPPEKILGWVKSKETRILELSSYLLKAARYVKYIEYDGTEKTYYDCFKSSLSYSDIRRIFDNRRSGLYDLVRNSDNKIVADYLYQFSSEYTFEEKVSNERIPLISISTDLLKSNIYLSDEQKNFIICRIEDISCKRK